MPSEQNTIFVRLRTGGREFRLSWRERTVFSILKANSPHTVTFEELQQRAECERSTLKWIISTLQPLVVHESGLIECIRKNGYRLVHTEKFE